MTGIRFVLLAATAVICVHGDEQEVRARYTQATSLAAANQYQEAFVLLEQLMREYPGTIRFAIEAAHLQQLMNQHVEAFVTATKAVSPIQTMLLDESTADAATRDFEEIDKILLKTIRMMETVLPANDENLIQVKSSRAKSLHSVGLGMMFQRTTSGWGRRVSAQSHAARVDAYSGNDPGDCTRKIVWGWSKEVPHLDIIKVAYPSIINLEAQTADYVIGPQISPVVWSKDIHGKPMRPFTEVALTNIVHLKNVYVDGTAPVGDESWGIYATECHVFSMSKLQSSTISAVYRGHLSKTITIEEPVISIVYPSLQNYFHILIEILPKLALLEIETRNGHQLSWLKNPPFGPNTTILAPDAPLIRKMLNFLDIDTDRIKYIRGSPDTQYLLKNCIMVEFSPPAGVYTAEGISNSKAKKIKYPAALAHVKGIKEGKKDNWDGLPHVGSDLWSIYRTPFAALRMVKSMFPSRTKRVNAKVKLVYLSRTRSPRMLKGLGEKKLLQELRKEFGSTVEITRHTGSGSFEEQRKVFENAHIMLGPHGAGMANMVYMPTNSSLIRFPLKPEIERCFEYMAAGLNFFYSDVEHLTAKHAGDYDLTSIHIKEVLRVVSDHVALQQSLLPSRVNKYDNTAGTEHIEL